MWGTVEMHQIFPIKNHQKIARSQLQLHPPRLTWNLKMMVWKMFLLFQGCILRFHVNLRGCTFFLRIAAFVHGLWSRCRSSVGWDHDGRGEPIRYIDGSVDWRAGGKSNQVTWTDEPIWPLSRPKPRWMFCFLHVEVDATLKKSPFFLDWFKFSTLSSPSGKPFKRMFH